MSKRKSREEPSSEGTSQRRVRFDETKEEDTWEQKRRQNGNGKEEREAPERPPAGGNEYDEDDDDDNGPIDRMTSAVEGEEDDGDDQYNEAGEAMEPFNLREEREEGFFDMNGNFIWRKQSQEPDAWLAGLDEAQMEEDIGNAASAKRKKDRAEAVDTVTDAMSALSKSELCATASLLMEPGETVLKAIKRLGKHAKGEAGAAERRKFEKLTELADHLLSRGFVDVYDTRKEVLTMGGTPTARGSNSDDEEESIRQQQSAAAVPVMNYFDTGVQNGAGSSEPDGGTEGGTMFEYRGKDGNIHGPFSIHQVQSWIAGGYFAPPNSVMMRPLPPKGSEKVTSSETPAAGTDDLMADLEDDEEEDTDPSAERSAEPAAGSEGEWANSETIDFSKYS